MRSTFVILVLAIAGGCGSDGGGNTEQYDQPYTFDRDGDAGAAVTAGAGGGAAGGGAGGASAGTGAGGTQGVLDAGQTSIADSGAVDDAGTGDPAPDTALFVPDVERTYVGSVIEPGLEIVSHSIVEGVFGHEWLVVLENVSADLRLCVITIDTTFLDAAGNEVAVSNLGLVRAPLKRGCSGTCGFMNCLNPGDVGMMVDEYGIRDTDVSQIASFTYSFGALDIVDAEPTTDATVSSLEVYTDELDSTHYRGLVVNHTSAPFDGGSVYVFGLNAVGRPLLAVSDATSSTIPAFDSWSFETGRFVVAVEDIASVVAFPEVSEP